MRISVTTLEAYRLFMDGDWMAEEDLIATIKGVSAKTDKIAVGNAFHSILEDPEKYRFDQEPFDYGYACGGLKFWGPTVEELLQKIDRRGIPELKTTRNYGGVTVVGKADHIVGTHIDEYKTTKNFDADKYLESYQWRFLLDIFGAKSLMYHVASVSPSDEDVIIRDIASMPVYPYPALHDDCCGLLVKFLGYISARNLGSYLQEKVYA